MSRMVECELVTSRANGWTEFWVRVTVGAASTRLGRSESGRTDFMLRVGCGGCALVEADGGEVKCGRPGYSSDHHGFTYTRVAGHDNFADGSLFHETCPAFSSQNRENGQYLGRGVHHVGGPVHRVSLCQPPADRPMIVGRRPRAHDSLHRNRGEEISKAHPFCC